MSRKIAILGTCASEDWRHYQSLRTPIDANIALQRQHSALISICSKPLGVPEDLGRQLKEWEVESMRKDLDKSFLAEMCAARPDYLIVDLLADARGGVIAYEGGWITRNYILRRSALSELADSRGLVTANGAPEKYLELFSQSARELKLFLDKHLPNCRVILHKARFAEAYIRADGETALFPDHQRLSHRTAHESAEALEAIFERDIPCDIISLSDRPILADVQHIWGQGALHYDRHYYTGFCSAFAAIMGREYPSS